MLDFLQLGDLLLVLLPNFFGLIFNHLQPFHSGIVGTLKGCQSLRKELFLTLKSLIFGSKDLRKLELGRFFILLLRL